MFGLAVTDLLRECLESNIEIENALNQLDFLKFLPKQFASSSKAYFLNSRILEGLQTACNNSRKNVDFVKREYIETYLTEICTPDYGQECYRVIFENPQVPEAYDAITQFAPYAHDAHYASRHGSHASVNGVGNKFTPSQSSGILVKGAQVCLLLSLCHLMDQIIRHPKSSNEFFHWILIAIS